MSAVPLNVSTDRPTYSSGRGHIKHPQPDIVKASVSAKTMADIWGLIGVAPSDGSTAARKRFVW
jgi:hypothetical protein